jgi:hypothetical protein
LPKKPKFEPLPKLSLHAESQRIGISVTTGMRLKAQATAVGTQSLANSVGQEESKLQVISEEEQMESLSALVKTMSERDKQRQATQF